MVAVHGEVGRELVLAVEGETVVGGEGGEDSQAITGEQLWFRQEDDGWLVSVGEVEKVEDSSSCTFNVPGEGFEGDCCVRRLVRTCQFKLIKSETVGGFVFD